MSLHLCHTQVIHEANDTSEQRMKGIKPVYFGHEEFNVNSKVFVFFLFKIFSTIGEGDNRNIQKSLSGKQTCFLNKVKYLVAESDENSRCAALYTLLAIQPES